MLRDFTRGVIRENPVFVTLLGLCPALAITTHVVNAAGFGAAVLLVIVASNLTVSLIRAVIPARIHYPVFLAVIAVYVTAVDLSMQAYLPALSARLGIFVPLIVVNCAVLARADVFARHAPPVRAALDGLGVGVGFILALSLIALVREVLGTGTITLFRIGAFDGAVRVPGLADEPAGVLVLAPGALLVMGYLYALFGRAAAGGGRRKEPAGDGRTQRTAGEGAHP